MAKRVINLPIIFDVLLPMVFPVAAGLGGPLAALSES
jgi:hypothetical protein